MNLKTKFFSLLAALALACSIATPASAQNFSSVAVLNGSCAAPSFTFYNDNDSGFYLVSAGIVGICVNGAEVARVSANGVTSNVSGAPVTFSQTTGRVTATMSAYTGTASQQAVEGDQTLSGTGLGKTGGYLGGVMGNVLGASTVTAAGNNGSNTAGVIGKYSIAGTAYTPGYKRGAVIGEASGASDCAFCAIASDSTNQEAITVDALFGVDHQFSFSGSAINWGLNLRAVGHDVYVGAYGPEAAYAKGDIQLLSTACVLSGSGVPSDGVNGTGAGNCARGSIWLDTSGGGLYSNTGSMASPVWTAR